MEETVVDNVSSEYKKDLKNKIIAVGLNSLGSAWGEEDKKLLTEFISMSLGEVLPTWDFLNDKVRFQIFVTHFTHFREYMEARIEKGEV